MNIDLLITPDRQAGLLADSNFVLKVTDVLFDAQGGIFSLEFADGDSLIFNIPVEEEFYDTLNDAPMMHIGSIQNGRIGQAYQAPLTFINDPYRAQLFKGHTLPEAPLMAFQAFVTRCVLGQPVHRVDAGDEDTLGCVIGETNPAMLEFAPQVARRLKLEVAPTLAPSIGAPGMGMGGSGPSGMSGGGMPPPSKSKGD